MIELTYEPIDQQAVIRSVGHNNAGAVVLFLGVTREMTGDQQTAWLEYEASGEMALANMRQLASRAGKQWPLLGCSIVHRLGRVEIGEASVAIAVSSPHRGDAIAASTWLIDTLKIETPIWKQENWADGRRQWVHPGAQTEQSPPQ